MTFSTQLMNYLQNSPENVGPENGHQGRLRGLKFEQKFQISMSYVSHSSWKWTQKLVFLGRENNAHTNRQQLKSNIEKDRRQGIFDNENSLNDPL